MSVQREYDVGMPLRDSCILKGTNWFICGTCRWMNWPGTATFPNVWRNKLANAVLEDKENTSEQKALASFIRKGSDLLDMDTSEELRESFLNQHRQWREVVKGRSFSIFAFTTEHDDRIQPFIKRQGVIYAGVHVPSTQFCTTCDWQPTLHTLTHFENTASTLDDSCGTISHGYRNLRNQGSCHSYPSQAFRWPSIGRTLARCSLITLAILRVQGSKHIPGCIIFHHEIHAFTRTSCTIKVYNSFVGGTITPEQRARVLCDTHHETLSTPTFTANGLSRIQYDTVGDSVPQTVCVSFTRDLSWVVRIMLQRSVLVLWCCAGCCSRQPRVKQFFHVLVLCGWERGSYVQFSSVSPARSYAEHQRCNDADWNDDNEDFHGEKETGAPGRFCYWNHRSLMFRARTVGFSRQTHPEESTDQHKRRMNEWWKNRVQYDENPDSDRCHNT